MGALLRDLAVLIVEDLPPIVPLLVVFVLGAAFGSFLNVCIYRLPLEKSLLWPKRSYCGSCLQPIAWYDNIPLVSYWVLGGRCRSCGQPFSVRYFLVELLTALGLVGLFYADVVANLYQFGPVAPKPLDPARFALARLTLFGFHSLLFCFLVVATFSDFDHQVIPLPLTVTGTIVGLVGAVLLSWPWPYTLEEAAPGGGGRFGPLIKMGVYPWPVWSPLPDWLKPGGNWQTGLATGFAGLLAGTLMLRAVRFLFGLGMGSEYMEPAPELGEEPQPWFAWRWASWLGRVGGRALGLGDADLMMMAGAFLGWQAVLVAFIAGVFPGLVFGLGQLALRGNRPMPFGPALAMGVMITALGWPWIGPRVRIFFFDSTLLLFFGIVSGGLMLFCRI